MKGWAFYLKETGRPFNCVGCWRVFERRYDANRYLDPKWCAANGVELRRVEIVERKAK